MADRDRRWEVKGSHERKGQGLELEIPVSLELVLIRASKDAAFRAALLEDPLEALEEQGIEMKPSETAMLLSMRRGVLETTIDRLRPEVHGRSRFARKVATAVAGSLVVSVMSCGEATSEADVRIDVCGGVGPDMPWDMPVESDVEEATPDPLDDVYSPDAIDAEDDADDADDADEDAEDDAEESDG
ncbi:MAG: hypothetical protein JRG91_04300 [Deltaproteobacteria bacterium]|nr:hypothetical protein [Deltaproteobacteria bacterium]